LFVKRPGVPLINTACAQRVGEMESR